MDLELVRLAQQGDHEAFVGLARSRGDRLFGVARRILHDVGLAEDAVQQALVIARRELPRLRDPERFDSWLTPLLVHECFAEAKRGRRLAANVRLLTLERQSTVDDTQSSLDRDQIERAFRRLPPDQRAILVLRHYVGLDPSEIAATRALRYWLVVAKGDRGYVFVWRIGVEDEPALMAPYKTLIEEVQASIRLTPATAKDPIPSASPTPWSQAAETLRARHKPGPSRSVRAFGRSVS